MLHNNINSNVCAAQNETEFHSTVHDRRVAVGVLWVMRGIIEIEQLGYSVECGIILKWRSWGTVCSAGYY